MGKNFLVILCVIGAILCGLGVSGQERFAISENGHFIAVLNPLNQSLTGRTNYSLEVFGTKRGRKLISKKFEHQEEEAVSLDISANGKLVGVGFSDVQMIYNTPSAVKLIEAPKTATFVFAYFDNIFAQFNGTEIILRDSYSGEILTKKKLTGLFPPLKGVFSPEDDFILIEDSRGSVFMVEVFGLRVKKRFKQVDSWTFNSTINQLVISQSSGTNPSITTYQLPRFGKVGKVNVASLHSDLMEIRIRSGRQNKRPVELSKLIRGSCSINSDGRFAYFMGSGEGDKVAELFVIDARTGAILTKYKLESQEFSDVKIQWIGSETIAIPSQKWTSLVFNVEKGNFEENLHFQLEDSKGIGIFEKWVQNKRQIRSANHRFTAYTSSSGFQIKRNQSREQVRFDNRFFLGFSGNSRYVFTSNGQGAYGFVDLLHFPDVVHVDFKEMEMDPPEPEIARDAVAPPDYNFKRFNRIKHIREAKPEDSLHLVLKSVHLGYNSGLELHVMDRYGNYYRGASEEDLKFVWCNFILQKNGNTRQVDNFIVEEFTSQDSLPNALALVMDFSGSMGWKRAEVIEKGVGKMIAKKPRQDRYSIHKYDTRVITEIRPEDNPEKLHQALYQTAYGSYRKRTALLDAAIAGINAIRALDGFKKYGLIIMTDGKENASFSTKNDVIEKALKGGVNIFTIGFGDDIDEDFLQTLAYSTGGGYYRIYDTQDLNWIFEDVYKRLQNYYSVYIQDGKPGSKVTQIKFCPPLENRTDSILIEYQPLLSDLKVVAEMEEHLITNPVKRTSRSKGSGAIRRDFSNIHSFSKVNSEINSQVRRDREEEAISYSEEITTAFEDIDLPRFNFYHDKVITVKEATGRIENVVEFLKRYPETKIIIEGHTDNTGTSEYNESLSWDRAQQVKNMLVAKGVRNNRIKIVGMGERYPIASNNTQKGRALNRRVVFRLWDGE